MSTTQIQPINTDFIRLVSCGQRTIIIIFKMFVLKIIQRDRKVMHIKSVIRKNNELYKFFVPY